MASVISPDCTTVAEPPEGRTSMRPTSRCRVNRYLKQQAREHDVVLHAPAAPSGTPTEHPRRCRAQALAQLRLYHQEFARATFGKADSDATPTEPDVSSRQFQAPSRTAAESGYANNVAENIHFAKIDAADASMSLLRAGRQFRIPQRRCFSQRPTANGATDAEAASPRLVTLQCWIEATGGVSEPAPGRRTKDEVVGSTFADSDNISYGASESLRGVANAGTQSAPLAGSHVSRLRWLRKRIQRRPSASAQLPADAGSPRPASPCDRLSGYVL